MEDGLSFPAVIESSMASRANLWLPALAIAAVLAASGCEGDEKAPKKAARKKAKEEASTDGKKIQLGATLGYGFTGEKAKAFSSDEWRLGAGLRVGYEFQYSLYGGVFYN